MSKIQHIAIIPDGNRRWAKQNNKTSPQGHKRGAEVMETILDKMLGLDIPYITVWGCSTSNLQKRDKAETASLYKLFTHYFKRLLKNKKVKEERVRTKVLGEWRKYFSDKLTSTIHRLEEVTEMYTENHLTFLMAYSGTEEMTQAIKIISQNRIDVTEDTIKNHLYTHELPPVDLIIRTGGEPHWSDGFMMWDCRNAHIYFTDTLWPDFTFNELQDCVKKFSSLEKRSGQ